MSEGEKIQEISWVGVFAFVFECIKVSHIKLITSF